MRYSSNQIVENIDNGEIEIRISSAVYPVKLLVHGLQVRLTDAVGGKILNKILHDGEEITINDNSLHILKLIKEAIPEIFVLY